VPEGKLIRIKAECVDNAISKVLIEGDFFLYPEEGVVKMEHALVGSDPKNIIEVTQRLERAVQENHMQLMGFSTRDLAELLWEIGCSEKDGA